MIAFCIYGEPASKANSRQIVMFGKLPRVIKSQKARDYERTALYQIPSEAKQMLTGELIITLHIYYASERSDLDESVVLDVLQAKFEKVRGVRVCTRKGVYLNDRQIREKHVYHFIDKKSPRVAVRIEQRTQLELLMPELPMISSTSQADPF
jgi:Holliday junction resolvase RusA-like endonuclease